MKTVFGVFTVFLSLALIGIDSEKVSGCSGGQTCSVNAQVTTVLNCYPDPVTRTYCVQQISQDVYGCSSESANPSCTAIVFGRATSCTSVADGCNLTGYDLQVDCCSGSGSGGGGSGTAACNSNETLVFYSPAQYQCQSAGACKLQSDGTGGLAGVLVDGFCDDTNACSHSSSGEALCWCHLGSCSVCTQVCGNTTNGCGYEQYGCSGGSCTANLACFWPGRIQGKTVPVPTANPTPLPVTVILDGVTNATANPNYTFSFADTNVGVSHAVSVLADPAYDIGYTKCINATGACHNVAIIPGTTARVSRRRLLNHPNGRTIRKPRKPRQGLMMNKEASHSGNSESQPPSTGAICDRTGYNITRQVSRPSA